MRLAGLSCTSGVSLRKGHLPLQLPATANADNEFLPKNVLLATDTGIDKRTDFKSGPNAHYSV